jgi:hypothetical protein
MNICVEFESQKKWVATIPEVKGARSYGSTRIEAAIGVTVLALLLLKNEPDKVWEEDAKDLLETLLAEFGEVGETPPESFLAGWADYKAGRVVDMDRALEDEPPLPAV